MKRWQNGQVMVEVMLIAAALSVALLLPFVNGRSVAELLLTVLLDCLKAQAYLLSIL